MSDSVKHRQSKASALAADGTLNPAPEKIRDQKFREDGFFDPRDIVQVKYEMLRRVSVDKMSVTDVSDEYGVSRPTFYQAKADFEDAGLAGLVPRKRGPHGPHKIQSEVLAFLRAQVVPGEPIRARELTNRLWTEFGLDVHPRTIERALGVKKTA
ncbi:MAG: helix-turn-helix domain-containing protein [Pseudomonadota bacterium]